MKSAYELAMERLGGEPEVVLTEAQKQEIAEIDRRCQAKTAEARLASGDRIKNAFGDSSKIDQIRQDLAVELASVNQKMERDKERVRNESK